MSQEAEHELGSAYALLRDAKKLIARPKSWCQGHARVTDVHTGSVMQRDLLGNYIVHSLDNRRGVIYIKRVATETLK